jgi:hypothetical protein
LQPDPFNFLFRVRTVTANSPEKSFKKTIDDRRDETDEKLIAVTDLPFARLNTTSLIELRDILSTRKTAPLSANFTGRLKPFTLNNGNDAHTASAKVNSAPTTIVVRLVMEHSSLAY